MGVITNAPNGTAVGSGGIHEAQRECVVWKDFMKNSGGFTIAGSAASGTGGMDGVDRITIASFINNSWFVLEAPDSSYQIMLSKVGEASSFQRLFINFASDWTGGGIGVEPTSPSNQAWYWGRNRNRTDTFTPNGIIYCSVEDQPPYRFFFVGTGVTGNELTVEGGISLVTFSNPPVGVPNYGLFYEQDYFANDWRAGLKIVHPSYATNLASRNLTAIGLSNLNFEGGTILPNGATAIVEEYKFPIASLPGGAANGSAVPPVYFGNMEWLKLEGYNQSDFQCIDDAEYICFDDTLVPWNGIAINKAKFS